MQQWAKEVIVDTIPFHSGIGVITSNGHVIGFRLQETTTGTRKFTTNYTLETTFIPVNTSEEFERPTKRDFVSVMEQLQLDQIFALSAPARIQSKVVNGNEMRYFEDVNGALYKKIVEAINDVHLFAEGSWSNTLLNPNVYENNPFSLSEITNVIKTNTGYRIVGEKCSLTVYCWVANCLYFGAKLGTVYDKMTDIAVTPDIVHNLLDGKLHVKINAKEDFYFTPEGQLYSSSVNSVFNDMVKRKLEKAYLKHAGLELTVSQKMARDVKQAKEQSSPFAALKNYKPYEGILR